MVKIEIKDIKTFMQDFSIKEVLSQNFMTKEIVYVLQRKGTEDQDSENRALCILKKKVFSSEFKSIDTDVLVNIDGFHSNPPFYAYYTDIKENEKIDNKLEMQIVFPLSEVLYKKYSFKPKGVIAETPELYKEVRIPEIKAKESNLFWIYSLLDGKKEVEKKLFDNKDYVIVYDYKYNDKEDPITALHMLLIFRDEKLQSMRDLDRSHLDLLEQAKEDVFALLRKEFNLDKLHVSLFFHYPPSFYRLHLHIIHFENNNTDFSANRAHCLDDVINNIRLVPNY